MTDLLPETRAPTVIIRPQNLFPLPTKMVRQTLRTVVARRIPLKTDSVNHALTFSTAES